MILPRVSRGFSRLFRRDDEDHADAHVEDLMKFLVLDPGRGGEQLEEGRDGPGAELDFGVEPLGQDARDIVHQAAAGDVGDALDLDFGADFADVGQVECVGAQQFVAERAAQAVGPATRSGSRAG